MDKPTLRQLNRAIQRYAKLQIVYQRRVWSNYSRTDVTGLVPDSSSTGGANPGYRAVPLDPVQYERIALSQHRLHVKVHQAAQEVEQLAKALGKSL